MNAISHVPLVGYIDVCLLACLHCPGHLFSFLSFFEGSENALSAKIASRGHFSVRVCVRIKAVACKRERERERQCFLPWNFVSPLLLQALPHRANSNPRKKRELHPFLQNELIFICREKDFFCLSFRPNLCEGERKKRGGLLHGFATETYDNFLCAPSYEGKTSFPFLRSAAASV